MSVPSIWGVCPSISKAVCPAGGLQLGLVEFCFKLGLKDLARACELTQGARRAVLVAQARNREVAWGRQQGLGHKHITVQAAASWLCLSPSWDSGRRAGESSSPQSQQNQCRGCQG